MMKYNQSDFFCFLIYLVTAFIICNVQLQADIKIDASDVNESASLLERSIHKLLEKQKVLIQEFEKSGNENLNSSLEMKAQKLAESWEYLIEKYPDDVMPYLFYGKFLRKLNQREKAQLIFINVMRMNPKLAVANQQISNFYAEDGNFTAAFGFIIKAIDIEPHTPIYHYQLGGLLHHYYRSFIDEEIFTREAIDRQMLEAFRKAAQLETNNRNYQFRYAETFYDVESPNWEMALEAWENIKKIKLSISEIAAVNLHQARILIQLQRYVEAEKLLTQVNTPHLLNTKNELIEKLNKISDQH